MLTVLSSIDAFADQDPTVTVMPFEGPNGATFRKQFVRELGRAATLISPSKFRNTAKKLNATKTTRRNVKKVSRRLGVDAIVYGNISRSKGKYTVKITLRAGSSGNVAKRLAVRSSSVRLKKRTLGKVRRSLVEEIDKLDRVPRKKPKPEKKPKSKDAKDGDQNDVEDDVAEDDLEKTDDAEVQPKEPGKRNKQYALHALVGAVGTSRKLSFTNRQGLATPAQTFDSGFFPGATVMVETYPFALGSKKSKAANFGLMLTLVKSFAAQSSVAYEDGGMQVQQTIPISQFNVGAGFIYRMSFGKRVRLKPLAAFHRRAYNFDLGNLPMGVTADLPDVAYLAAEAGGNLEIDILEDMTLGMGGVGLYAFSSGAIQKQSEFGGTRAFGFETGGFLEYRVQGNIPIRFGGTFAFIGHNFTGSGEKANNRDGNPMSVDVGGASDQYLTFYLSSGYRF